MTSLVTRFPKFDESPENPTQTLIVCPLTLGLVRHSRARHPLISYPKWTVPWASSVAAFVEWGDLRRPVHRPEGSLRRLQLSVGQLKDPIGNRLKKLQLSAEPLANQGCCIARPDPRARRHDLPATVWHRRRESLSRACLRH